ncbi:MAG: laccase domain-containing protein, partial [Clostridia bacterium]|nr:laccase domain-containing protein [Clostridia bacterium]
MRLPNTATLCAHQKNGVVYYSFPQMDAYPFLKAGLSTRLGGVSEGIYASMNLSYTRGDEKTAVNENFRRMCNAMGLPLDGVVISAQEHHTNLQNVTAKDRGKGVTFTGFKDVDGLLTDEAGVVLCTQYADCVPLLFADPKKHVVAASHAGWRGTVDEIGRLTVERMHSDYGCDPADIVVGIAPSIGKCCFEVD